MHLAENTMVCMSACFPSTCTGSFAVTQVVQIAVEFHVIEGAQVNAVTKQGEQARALSGKTVTNLGS